VRQIPAVITAAKRLGLALDYEDFFQHG
jgi:hypothetical protein